jgi:predicted nucleic acid-binding Zn ribbon protein
MWTNDELLNGAWREPESRCVVCGKVLRAGRTHVDTCGERCFRALLKRQREGT